MRDPEWCPDPEPNPFANQPESAPLRRWVSPAVARSLYNPAFDAMGRKPEWFWRLVDMSGGPDACWPWRGSRDRDGYGVARGDGPSTHAHRIALELETGKALGEAYACHHCDNPPCCNPKHLYVGNAQTNATDREARRVPA